ncbi:MAG: NAD(P)H-hydrate dehydratase [Clostridia bacterium]|nr:NAD(P)H-hydrate dehydratase [Clostridia bacterium]MDH7572062.1 NAD(P)H-hydrate dehydratase [Clostridia bacterium]
MKLVTAEEMGRLDRLSSSEYGIPTLLLMENAGLRVLEVIRRHFSEHLRGRRVLIFAGKGNNGGDGLVVGRHLLNAGAEVKVFLLARPEEVRGDAAVNLAIYQKMGGKLFPLLEDKDLQRVDVSLLYAELAVDAIYGTGFRGAASGLAARVIEMLSQSRVPVAAVDLPSGLEADTGRVNGPCVSATYTVTFALPKLGLYLYPGAAHVGRVVVADIGIPQALVGAQPLNRELVTEEWVRERLRPRRPWSHKGDYGHVLVVGGSPGLTGAVVMAAEGALRSGAGLVTAAVPAALHSVLEEKTLEVMTLPLPGGEVLQGSEALAAVEEFSRRCQAVALGPGLGRHPGTQSLVRQLLPRLRCPLVLDADGLNALAGHLGVLREVRVPAVLTPHPGEMARLLETSSARVQEDRIGTAERAARDWGVTVVLKGARTVVASPSGATYLIATGNPGMATGGSGDVLTGIISGFLAQGMPAEEAAAAAAHLHGAAGDAALAERGQRALTAGDLLAYLPRVLKQTEGVD